MSFSSHARFAVAVAVICALSTTVRSEDKPFKPDSTSQLGKTLGSPICAAQCAADLIADGFVNIDDLVAVITGWGVCVSCPPHCTGDANHNCVVNIDDLVMVITGWGPCPPPSNNNCANPIQTGTPIFGNTLTWDFCTRNATTDGATEPTCLFCCSDPQIHKDIWYNVITPPGGGGGTLQLDTCGSDFDTKIAVYRSPAGGCACPGAGALLVVCNDDAGDACGLSSRLQFTMIASTCYLIRVGGYNGQSGSGPLHVRFAIAGEECFSAIDIGTVTANTSLTVAGSTDVAQPSVSGLAAPCTDAPDGNDLWYKFQIGCGGNVIGSAFTCNPDTNFDTILTLYRGTCEGLIEVGCNDDYTGNPACQLNGLFRKSLVDLPNAAAAGYYYVRVSGYHGASGNFRLNVGLQCIN